MVIRKFYSVILLLFSICNYSLAQNQDDVWIFGESAQLNFSSGTPVASTGNAMSAGEGCASVTNQSGQLLFYTNGITVWNSNHVPMANGTGLLGHNSSTNSAVIVPKPNSSSKYYIFTTGAADNNFLSSLMYSEVDMCLNAGLGGVTVKNAYMTNDIISEKLSVIPHTMPGIIWLVAHEMYSNAFLAYQISATGVSLVPVVSSVGVSLTVADDARGEMKASPSGQKIAMPIRSSRTIHLFDFNRTTGAVSNPVSWSIPQGGLLYGAEFSPNETRLYATRYGFGAFLHQFNLAAGSAAAIGASGIVVGSSSSDHMAGMKLGPDGKIYVTRQEFYGVGGGAANGGAAYLAVINQPNTLGTGCNFVDNGIFLAGGRSRFGLPPKVVVNASTPNSASISASTACAGNPVNFSITFSGQVPATVTWNFGDPGSGSSNSSTLISPNHIFSSPGPYTVTATYVLDCSTIVVTQAVTVPPVSQPVNIGPDTTICQGSSIALSTGSTPGPFLWNNGSTSPSITVAAPGTYWVQTGTAPCVARDSIVVGLAPIPSVNLGPDKILCQGAQTTLSVTQISGNTYSWSNGSTGPSVVVSTAGTYALTVSNGFCSATDVVNVSTIPLPVVSLGNDMILCPGGSLTLSAAGALGPYTWSNGATSASININTPGVYWLEAGTSPCQARDSILVSASTLPVVDLGQDITLCAGQTTSLSVTQAVGNSYNWSTGATGSGITVENPGVYWVSVTNGNCSDTDSITIAVLAYPTVSLGADLFLCPGETVNISSTGTPGPYVWSTGATTASVAVNSSGVYWLSVSNGVCTTVDSINVTSVPLPAFSLGSDTTLCAGNTLSLTPPLVAGATYLWSNGTTGGSLNVSTTGNYWLEISLQGCSVSDSVNVNIVPQPFVNLGADTTLCTQTLLDLSVSHVPGQTYLWSTGQTSSSIQVSVSGNYWLAVSNGFCQSSDSIAVEYFNQFSLGPDSVLCQGQTLTLNSFLLGGNAYTWSNGNLEPILEVTEPGIYWVQVTGANCQVTDTISVGFQALPVVNLGADVTVCEGATATLSSAQTTTTQLLWNNGAVTTTLEVSEAGLYWLQATEMHCANSDTVQVFVQALPVVELGADTTICLDATYTLSVPNIAGQNYLWGNGSTASAVFVAAPGLYVLEVEENGCRTLDSVQVNMEDCIFFVPNIFTPNNDNSNDYFVVNGMRSEVWELNIFNRYGKLVYNSPHYKNEWNGNAVADGVYYYQLTNKRTSQSYKGYVTVLR